LGGNHSQLGWHQLHTPRCDAAGNTTDTTAGCWCADVDWNDPLGDGRVYRLTGYIPAEWLGAAYAEPDDFLDRGGMRGVTATSEGGMRGVTATPVGGTRPRREPPNRYTHPRAWRDAPTSSTQGRFYSALEAGYGNRKQEWTTVTDRAIYDYEYYNEIDFPDDRRPTLDSVNPDYTDDYGVIHDYHVALDTGVANPYPERPPNPGFNWHVTLKSL
jgi:hypothetical protein